MVGNASKSKKCNCKEKQNNLIENDASNNLSPAEHNESIFAVFIPETKKLKLVESRKTVEKIINDAKGLIECEIRIFTGVDDLQRFQFELGKSARVDSVSLKWCCC